MLRYGIFAAVVLGSALVVTGLNAGGVVKSGPKVGEDVPGPFHPLNVTGESKGKKACLYCANGGIRSPSFSREATPAVASLLKQLTRPRPRTAKSRWAAMPSSAATRTAWIKQPKAGGRSKAEDADPVDRQVPRGRRTMPSPRMRTLPCSSTRISR